MRLFIRIIFILVLGLSGCGRSGKTNAAADKAVAKAPAAIEPVATTQVPPPNEKPEIPEGIRAGLKALRQNYSSFVYSAKRTLVVTTEGINRRRSDDLQMTLDSEGNYHFKKDGSFQKSKIDFYRIKDRVYRADTAQWFDYTQAQTAFSPLVANTTTYGEDFWREFGSQMKLAKKGSGEWKGTKCDRYMISSSAEDNAASSTPSHDPKVSGELLVDPTTHAIVHSVFKATFTQALPDEIQKQVQKIKAPQTTPTPGSIATEANALPGMTLEVAVQESVEKINQVEKVEIPSAEPKTTEIKKPAKPAAKRK